MSGSVKKQTIGFIGLGRMGTPMSKNILKNGYPLIVWDRTASKTVELVKAGAKAAQAPSEVIRNADITISMLATPQATEEVILGQAIQGIAKGKTLIDMGSNLPATAKKIAQQVTALGGGFVDAPVLGSVDPATQATLTILAAGNKTVVEYVTPILQTMGKRVWYVGETGKGCTMKLAINLHLNVLMGAFSEALTFGAKAGIDPAQMIDILNDSTGRTFITEAKGGKTLEGDYSPAFALELAYKDAYLASQVAKEIDAPTPLSNVVKDLYASAASNGKAKLDFSALTLVYEQLGNIKIQEKKGKKGLIFSLNF